jgi:hypothetical protein
MSDSEYEEYEECERCNKKEPCLEECNNCSYKVCYKCSYEDGLFCDGCGRTYCYYCFDSNYGIAEISKKCWVCNRQICNICFDDFKDFKDICNICIYKLENPKLINELENLNKELNKIKEKKKFIDLTFKFKN